MKTFAPGDLVVIKKQVQTTQEHGPAKARMHARGPYRVIEQIKPGTYRVQKLPGTQGAGRRGRITKESAARLTKIPSTLVIHKPTTGIDTRLATYRHAIVDNPLENILGLHEPGRYQQVEPELPYAYDKIEDMWQEEVDNFPHPEGNNDNEDSSDSSNSEGNDSDSDNDANDDSMNLRPTEHDTNGTETPTEHGPNGTETNNGGTTEAEPPKDNPSPPDNEPKQPAQAKEVRTRTSKRKNPTIEATAHRTSARAAKRPARYRENEPTQGHHRQPTNRTQAHSLYKQIRKSRDKLFFIRHTIDTTNTQRWYVVQVQLQDDDRITTRDEGEYNVRFYIREQANSKERQQRNCRYWPEIHEIKHNGALGKIIPIRPGRVDRILQEQQNRLAAYEQTVNLLDKALVGPFDFAIPRDYQNESNRIEFERWEDLKIAATGHDMDTSDIEDIIPLR